MNFALKTVASAVAVWVAVFLVPGLRFDGSLVNLAVIAVLVGFANSVVRPILTMLSLPIVILTLGLFLLVTNAMALGFVVWLSAPGRLDTGLTSTGFVATLLGALVISLVRGAAEQVLGVD